jgi:hypothetical protein
MISAASQFRSSTPHATFRPHAARMEIGDNRHGVENSACKNAASKFFGTQCRIAARPPVLCGTTTGSTRKDIR